MIVVDGNHIHVPNNPYVPDFYVCSRENEHFHNDLELKDAIMVCDRGYEANNNIVYLQEVGIKYVIRVKEIGHYGIAEGLDIPNSIEFDLNINLSLTRKHD